jgi:DNA-binding transcriptional LysR family regulator
MELRHLRYLIAVAEEHSFVAAATRLHLAQPALSRQIRDLETELGIELFVRDSSGTRLTAAGDACLHAARALLENLDNAIERTRQAEHGLIGTCTIGAGRYPLWNGMLPRLLEHVRNEYPGIEVMVDERSLRSQWDALADAKIDIAFGTAPPGEYAQFVVETHSLDLIDAIVVSKRHHLANRESVSIKELRTETWVRLAPTVSDEPTRIFQSVLSNSGFVPESTRNAANDDALRMLVRSGAGWSPLPRSLRAGLAESLVAVPLDDLAVPFRYVHFHRRGDNRPVVRSVLGAMRRAARREGFGAAKEQAPKNAVAERQKLNGTRLELRHLRYFVATIEHETIGRAAENLDITQPGLSRQLRDLEQEVGATLILRNARGVEPTLAGKALYSEAVRILKSADQMASEAQRALRGTAGQVVIGLAASPIIWETITKVVADCSSRLPQITVTVEDVPTPLQGKALHEAKLDLAIGHRYPSISDLDPGVARVQLLPDMFNQALISASHPLAGEAEISLKDLGDLPFLFMKRPFSPALYDLVMSTFERANYRPKIEGTYDGLSTVWALAAQNMGFTLGMASQKKYPPHGVVAVRLKDFNLQWGAELSRRSDEARPAVVAVIEAIHRAARELMVESMTSQETKYWPQVALTG